jgi:hypothetical protein
VVCEIEEKAGFCGEHCSNEYTGLSKYSHCISDEVCGQPWFIIGDSVEEDKLSVDFDDLD